MYDYTVNITWDTILRCQPSDITITFGYINGETTDLTNVNFTAANNWTNTLSTNAANPSDIIIHKVKFNNNDYVSVYEPTLTYKSTTLTVQFGIKDYSGTTTVANLANPLQTDTRSTISFKEGNYTNMYTIIECTGVPQNAILFLVDEHDQKLYSPYDINGHATKTACSIVANQKNALQLPARYNGNEWTDYPMGTYYWQLWFPGDNNYDEQFLPITVKIDKFETWELDKETLYQQDDLIVNVRTYGDTIPVGRYYEDSDAHKQYMVDGDGTIIFNGLRNQMAIGEHNYTLYINGDTEKIQTLSYTILPPLDVTQGGSNPATYSGQNLINQTGAGYILATAKNELTFTDNIQLYVNGVLDTDIMVRNISDTERAIYRTSSLLPPGVHQLTIRATLSDNNTYERTLQYHISPQGYELEFRINGDGDLILSLNSNIANHFSIVDGDLISTKSGYHINKDGDIILTI